MVTNKEREKAIANCLNLDCSAPICPLDTLKKICVWFADEEICKTDFPPGWVKNQKKIQKRSKNFDTYYTFKMLNRNCIIKKPFTGITPEGFGRITLEEKEKSWLKSHPAKRILTEKEKEVLRKRFLKNIGKKVE